MREAGDPTVKVLRRKAGRSSPTMDCRMSPKSRIMYLEKKNGLTGPAWIGRLTFSKTGRSLHYRGRTFRSLKGKGFKANYFDVENGDEYWISGCHADGQDRLYGERLPVLIDEDVRQEYWRDIRRSPDPEKAKAASQ